MGAVLAAVQVEYLGLDHEGGISDSLGSILETLLCLACKIFLRQVTSVIQP